jgi:hypothetical protein
MIQELKDYFNSIEIPTEPVYLHASTKIDDVRFFLNSHFNALEHNPDTKVNAPMIDRLILLKTILEQKNESHSEAQ